MMSSKIQQCCIIHILLLVLEQAIVSSYHDVNLPMEHWAYYFNNNKTAARLCQNEQNCLYKKHLNVDVCWGYEEDCVGVRSYAIPNCSGAANGWAESKVEQFQSFYSGGDFGYIRQQKEELRTLCTPEASGDSFLACTNYTRFCQARNIMMDFSRLLTLAEPVKYKDNILGSGLIGGHCKLNSKLLGEMGTHKSPLQSWYAELEHFMELDHEPIGAGKCDVVVDRPTFIMKLDAPINMYHHFCDFINLYNSFHLNNSFSRDVNIVLWDTLSYYGNFGVTWKAFTKHPVITLAEWKGKKVCFKDLILPLLPRMIFGMYYNMPLVPGCRNSGLFHAFNRYILHNLGVKQDERKDDKIRITLLARNTVHRNVMNEAEILEALGNVSQYHVKKVVYSYRLPFIDQLQITQNTDIFIGMHGAGLTHLLFLPDWAVIFELYNCDDEYCYKDLARLRGVYYQTWENPDLMQAKDQGHHPTIGAHPKFTDYSFDVPELLRLVKKSADYVRSHHLYKKVSTRKKRPYPDEL